MGVAVILEAFEASSDEEGAKLTKSQWDTFCKTWCKHVELPEGGVFDNFSDAFRMDMQHLVTFFKGLPEPMGFSGLVQPEMTRKEMEHVDKTVLAEIMEMHLNPIQMKDEKDKIFAEFTNVAVAVAKRVMLAAQQGDSEELDNQFRMAEKIEQKQSGRSLDAGRDPNHVIHKLNAMQYFAAKTISDAVKAHKFRDKVRARIAAEYSSTGAAVEELAPRSSWDDQ